MIILNSERYKSLLSYDVESKKIFTKEYQPYEIGFISKERLKIKTFGKLQW